MHFCLHIKASSLRLEGNPLKPIPPRCWSANHYRLCINFVQRFSCAQSSLAKFNVTHASIPWNVIHSPTEAQHGSSLPFAIKYCHARNFGKLQKRSAKPWLLSYNWTLMQNCWSGILTRWTTRGGWARWCCIQYSSRSQPLSTVERN